MISIANLRKILKSFETFLPPPNFQVPSADRRQKGNTPLRKPFKIFFFFSLFRKYNL